MKVVPSKLNSHRVECLSVTVYVKSLSKITSHRIIVLIDLYCI